MYKKKQVDQREFRDDLHLAENEFPCLSCLKEEKKKEKNAVPELGFLRWHSTHQMIQR